MQKPPSNLSQIAGLKPEGDFFISIFLFLPIKTCKARFCTDLLLSQQLVRYIYKRSLRINLEKYEAYPL
eukprot:UN13891